MIRPAHPADAAAIAAIWNAVIRDTALTITTVEKTAPALAEQIASQPVFVADAGGAGQGFVTWAPFRAGPGYAHTAEHSVHVADGARGRGLGRALMAEALTQARADGQHAMIAAIAGENPDGIAFHAALGFREVGRLPETGWKFGRWHDLVLMQKML